MDTRIVLISMVKNESKILERCLKSVEDVCDAFVFLDTGSTDSTVGVITNFLKTHRGKLYESPFVNFGVSRSKSFDVAVEYIQSVGWDLNKTYGLLLDADMVLRYTPSFLSAKKKLTEGGYKLIQSAGNLDYHNTRFVRLGDKWRCVGVTHEYWDNQSGGSQPAIEKDMAYIYDVNDGGCKSDKFERDVRLLAKGLEEEPENKVRYTFYLAQSYESIDKKKAIEYYKKRIELGGWFEELYIASMRIGDMCENEAEKVFWYLEACERDPKRSEAYYRLARHYRTVGKNNLASKFIVIGKPIKFPKDRSLFLEKDVYDYRFDEELSICGFYVDGFRDLGSKACNKLVLSRGISPSSRDLAFNNQFFYIGKLPYPILEKKEWTIATHPTFKSSSCSFVYDGTSFQGIQRTVNYHIDKGQYIYDGPVRTVNYFIEGSGCDIIASTEIKVLVPKKREARVQDLEDMRFFGNRYALGTTYEYGDYDHPCQVLCTFNEDKNISSIVPLKYEDNTCQKNWCPFVHDNKVLCIYSYEPFIILEINPETGTCSEYMHKEQPLFLKDFRGSTSPVRIGDTYYQLIHVVYFKDTRKYVHRMIQYDLSFTIQKISDPFFFDEMTIEYSLGLGYDGKHTYIHYSTLDNKSTVLKCNVI